jgi:hypothetical protein
MQQDALFFFWVEQKLRFARLTIKLYEGGIPNEQIYRTVFLRRRNYHFPGRISHGYPKRPAANG